MNRRFFHSLFVVAIAGIGACASTHTSGPGPSSATPAAFVDMARAVRDCREGRLASAELMQTHEKFQRALDAEGDRLRDAQLRLGVLRGNGEDVSERQRTLGQAEVALHAKYEQLQHRLTDVEQKRADTIRAHLVTLLPQLAAAHHINGPIAETPPANAGSSLDLTDELIRSTETLPAAP
jgi:Skp family chaperone for outer membrane proteins